MPIRLKPTSRNQKKNDQNFIKKLSSFIMPLECEINKIMLPGIKIKQTEQNYNKGPRTGVS